MSESFDENKVRRDKQGRFADQDKHHKPSDLPPQDAGNTPVGEEFIDRTNDIASGLFDHKMDWEDLPIGDCYRINDFGDYVTEPDWCEVWDDHPLEEKAWMLADNGQYSSDDVAKMTPAEIEAAYDDADFDPAYVFYTEKYEDDYDLSEPIGTGMAQTIRQTGERLGKQSRESMDFQPGDRAHATPDGFVSEDEWNQAWNDQPAFAPTAYELSCRHPGLSMEKLSPMQIATMNHSEKEYEQYVYASGGSHGDESDLRLSPNARRDADMYRQNERNAKYVGRDLNNVICMREDEYAGNDGTLTANVRQSTLRVLGSPEPTADMDSMSTIALGLNHDSDATVRMIAGQTSGHSDERDLKHALREQLQSPNYVYDQANAERLSTVMDCIANNTDDTNGGAWLATSLKAFCDWRHGDKEQAGYTAGLVRRMHRTTASDNPTWRAADTVAAAILGE